MIKFSILIPFKSQSSYLLECIKYIKIQNYNNFELILLPDKYIKNRQINDRRIKIVQTGDIAPAKKRDIGAKVAKGEILAFIDDDAYPGKNWLKNAIINFRDKNVAAVGGPGVTPFDDDLQKQAGGWVNSLWFGSGGAGNFRFVQKKKRYVDDFPSMNFFVRKSVFLRAGGFDTHFWPGEDTKLCHDIVYKLNKKIIYDPEMLVYHHRRPLFLPHLKQISRYAVHRGHFARIFPKTSLRLGYLMPTFFVAYLTFVPLIIVFAPQYISLYSSALYLYLILLFYNIMIVFIKTKNIILAFLTGTGILLTHVIYGLLFPIGFFKKSLKQ